MSKRLKPLSFNQIFLPKGNFEFTEEFVRIFLEDGVVLLRDFDCSLDDQMIITNNFKNKFPKLFYLENPLFHYSENHQHTVEMRATQESPVAGQDDIFIEWHMEMIGYPNPAVGATWNMKTFKCDAESGKTFFYDAIKLTNEISVNDLELLKKCKFKINIIENKESICPIKYHSILNNELIYVDPVGNYTIVECENVELELYNNLLKYLINKIKNDKNNLIIHKWKQNDIIFVDLSRMYHAVTGGFSPSERHFEGMWLNGFAGSKYGTI